MFLLYPKSCLVIHELPSCACVFMFMCIGLTHVINVFYCCESRALKYTRMPNVCYHRSSRKVKSTLKNLVANLLESVQRPSNNVRWKSLSTPAGARAPTLSHRSNLIDFPRTRFFQFPIEITRQIPVHNRPVSRALVQPVLTNCRTLDSVCDRVEKGFGLYGLM